MKSNKVFVYGTLKEGEGNDVFLKGQKKIGNDDITGFKLYALGYGFPAIINTGNDKDFVSGELYEVDEDTLMNIDLLEGYRGENYINHYERMKVKTVAGYEAYVYYYTEDKLDDVQHVEIDGGYWDNIRHVDAFYKNIMMNRYCNSND